MFPFPTPGIAMHRTAASLSLGTLALAAAASLAAQEPQVPIREWQVPWERSRPRDPAVGSADRIWFVGQVGNYLAYLTPSTGEFKRYELEARALPHNVVLDREGYPWYAGNGNGHIGRLDPATGRVTRYAMPDSAARDPHTLVFDRHGALWFTVQGGNYVGRLAPATGKVDLIKVPTPSARPYGIALDSKGRPWFNEFGAAKIAMIDPATLTIREYDLPDPKARDRRIAITSDDRVWYVDYTRGYLGRLDPATGAVREWPMPSGPMALPYAMTVDDRDRLWFVETGVQPNRLVGFDPKAERFFGATPVPSGGGTIRHMVFDRATRQVWFGSDNNTIGRASVGQVTVTLP